LARGNQIAPNSMQRRPTITPRGFSRAVLYRSVVRLDPTPTKSGATGMRSSVRFTLINGALALACAMPAGAQAASIMSDLMGDVAETEKKFVDLAKAIPQDKYDWRPAPGIRSINEVLRHVA